MNFGLKRFDEAKATIDAFSRSQAMIEFKPDGTILSANENFLGAMGYTLEEIRGQHHGMFVEPTYRSSSEYREFWQKLGRGEFQAAEFKPQFAQRRRDADRRRLAKAAAGRLGFAGVHEPAHERAGGEHDRWRANGQTLRWPLGQIGEG